MFNLLARPVLNCASLYVHRDVIFTGDSLPRSYITADIGQVAGVLFIFARTVGQLSSAVSIFNEKWIDLKTMSEARAEASRC